MEFVNEWEKSPKGLSLEDLEIFLKILAPFAPYITEELFQKVKEARVDSNADVKNRSSAVNEKVSNGSLKGKDHFISIHVQSWPEYDQALVKDETVDIAVQVNGKLRVVLRDHRVGSLQEEIEKEAKEQVKKHLDGKTPKKVIYIKDRLINIVV